MDLRWDAVYRFMVTVVMLVAPPSRFIVKVGNRTENPPGQKIPLNILDKSFYGLSEHADKPYYTHTFFIRTLDGSVGFLSFSFTNVRIKVLRQTEFLFQIICMAQPFRQLIRFSIASFFNNSFHLLW